MTISVNSPADMVNLALRRIGYKLRVGMLYEGSAAAKQALDVYAQTRDATLIAKQWEFAKASVTGSLLKSAPAGGYIPPTTWNPADNPALPWLYEYSYPSDALAILSVRSTPFFTASYDPVPQRFDVQNDNTFTPPVKVILTNLAGAVIQYTRQVTDPQAWEPDFIEEFAAALGESLAPTLKDLQTAKLAAAAEQNDQQTFPDREQQ